jgi:4-hydroxythreonine-4-phosphate dehydrogenase
MTFVGKNNFIVATHTTHMSLLKAIKKVKKNNLIKKLKLLYSALRNQLNIKNPKILVTGLNPHAGENNMFGNEESKFIIPAINELKKLNILVDGPIPADTALLKDNMNKYDCIYYMYHDQALCAFKALFFDSGVNLTLGLPIIRTSVDHGTAEELVGKKDKISIKSFLNALNIAQKFSQE